MAGQSFRFSFLREEEQPHYCQDCGYPCEWRQLPSGLDYYWCVICEHESRNEPEPDLMLDWPDLEDTTNLDFPLGWPFQDEAPQPDW